MHKITKQMRTETGHRLMNYDGRCAHLHGHSYLWEVTVEGVGGLDHRGMVADFKDVKAAMMIVLDPLDHCMVLAHDDPLWDLNVFTIERGQHVDADLPAALVATNGEEPRLVAWHENPTAESFAEWALHEINARLPSDIQVVSVKVWETATSFAEFTKDRRGV